MILKSNNGSYPLDGVANFTEFPLFQNVLATIDRKWKVMLKLLVAVLPKLWKVKDNREKYDNTTANSSTLFRHGLDSAQSKITF